MEGDDGIESQLPNDGLERFGKLMARGFLQNMCKIGGTKLGSALNVLCDRRIAVRLGGAGARPATSSGKALWSKEPLPGSCRASGCALCKISVDEEDAVRLIVAERGNMRVEEGSELVDGSFAVGKDVCSCLHVDGHTLWGCINSDVDDYGTEEYAGQWNGWSDDHEYGRQSGSSRQGDGRPGNLLELAVINHKLNAAKGIQDGLRERGEPFLLSRTRFWQLMSWPSGDPQAIEAAERLLRGTA